MNELFIKTSDVDDEYNNGVKRMNKKLEYNCQMGYTTFKFLQKTNEIFGYEPYSIRKIIIKIKKFK